MKTRFYLQRTSGFSLSEVIISASILIIAFAVVIVGSISLQKSFTATRKFSESQMGQLRLIDYVTQDLRKAVAIKVTKTDGSSAGTNLNPFIALGTENSVTIKEGIELVIEQPGFYEGNTKTKLNDPANPEYTTKNPLIWINGSVEYGSSATTKAPNIKVVYTKKEIGGISYYTRQEGSSAEEILLKDDEDSFDLDLIIRSNRPEVVVVQVWFDKPFLFYRSKDTSNNAEIGSSDSVLIRNPREDT